MSAVRTVFAVLVLMGPSVLPLLATLGVRAESAALLIPVGFLFAGLAATLAVITHVTLVFWLAVVVVAANVLAGRELWRRYRSGRALFPVHRRLSDWTPAIATLVVSAYGLTEFISQGPDPDTLSIWFLHARLLDSGAISYVGAMHSASYSFSHLEYPLAVPGAVNEMWSAAGSVNYLLGQVVITLLGVSLLVLVVSLLGRVIQQRAGTRVTVALCVLFSLATFAVSGRYATDGYADVPVALAALAGGIALLLLPRSSTTTAIGVACLWLAGITKPEGLFAAAAVALLVTIRRHLADSKRRDVDVRRALVRAGSSFAVLVLPGALWAAYAGVVVTAPVYYGPIPPDDLSVLHRAGLAWSQLIDRLWFVGLLVPIIFIAAWAWQRTRRRWQLASVTWLGGFLLLYLLGLIVRYATGPWNVRWWLATSSDRVTMLPRLLMLTELTLIVAFSVTEWPQFVAWLRSVAASRRDARGWRAGSSPSLAETTRSRG